MAISERLAYVLTFDTASGVKSLQKVGATADKELGKVDKKLDKIGSGMQKFGAGAMAFAGLAGVGLFKMASGAADAEANMSALEQVVGETVAQDIGRWAEDSAKGVGLASKDAVAASTSFAQLGKIIGLGGEDLSKFSTDLVGLSSDFAAFKNVAPEQALQDIQAAFAGSTEVMRKYGIFLDDATLKSAYFRETGEEVTGTLTAQQKIVAINSEMYRQGADMIGQWGRESEELSGQQAILKAELTNLSDEIGAGILPMLVSVMGTANDIVGVFSSLDSATNGMIGKFAGIGTVALGAAGALSFVAGSALKARAAMLELRAVSLAWLGPVGAVAAGATIAAIALTQLGDAQRDNIHRLRNQTVENLAAAAQGLEDLKAAAQAMDDPAAAVAARLRDIAMESPGLSAKLADVGMTVEELAELMVDGKWSDTVGFRRFTDAAGESQVMSDELGDALRRVDYDAQIVGRNFEALAAVSDDVTSATEDNTDATEDNITTTKAAARAAEESRDALRDQRQAIDEAREALEAQRQSVLASIDSDLAYRNQQADTAAAVRDATDAMGAAEVGTDDYAQAARDAESAVLDQAAAAVDLASDQAEANGKTLTAQARTKIYRDELLTLVGYLTGPAQSAVQGHIDVLSRVPSTVRTNVITTYTSTRAGGSGIVEGSGVQGATGGIVTKPTMALIGEAGPEAVIPLNQTPGSSPLPSNLSTSTDASASDRPIVLVIEGQPFRAMLADFEQQQVAELMAGMR